MATQLRKPNIVKKIFLLIICTFFVSLSGCGPSKVILQLYINDDFSGNMRVYGQVYIWEYSYELEQEILKNNRLKEKVKINDCSERVSSDPEFAESSAEEGFKSRRISFCYDYIYDDEAYKSELDIIGEYHNFMTFLQKHFKDLDFEVKKKGSIFSFLIHGISGDDIREEGDVALFSIKYRGRILNSNAHLFNKDTKFMVWNLHKLDEKGIYFVLDTKPHTKNSIPQNQ